MNENLQNALTEILNKATSGIDTSVEFMQAELPDVITQLLTWYAVYNGALTLLALLIIAVIAMGWVKLIKINNQSEYGVDVEDFVIAVMVSTILFVVAIVLFNLEWLQILIAPKIWLIEYAATLVK
ncbi:MAG: hypothetical protein GY919_08275 [Photobacterium aquimaris]|nr:hypothetical protein [Photobacterium aquimaris]